MRVNPVLRPVPSVCHAARTRASAGHADVRTHPPRTDHGPRRHGELPRGVAPASGPAARAPLAIYGFARLVDELGDEVAAIASKR